MTPLTSLGKMPTREEYIALVKLFETSEFEDLIWHWTATASLKAMLARYHIYTESDDENKKSLCYYMYQAAITGYGLKKNISREEVLRRLNANS